MMHVRSEEYVVIYNKVDDESRKRGSENFKEKTIK
jgi:hypothetical protein